MIRGGGGIIGGEKHSERHLVFVLGLVIPPKSLEQFSDATRALTNFKSSRHGFGFRPTNSPGKDDVEEPVYEYLINP